jgi:CSLREA domain-containing protein
MLNRLPLITALLVLCLLVLSPSVSAQEEVGADFLVTRADDPPPNGCAVGDCSLREAILAANANSDYSDILLQTPGPIELSITGANENLGATGDLDILYPTRIAGNVVVDANGIDRVFDIVAAGPINAPERTPTGPDVQLIALIITGGNVDVTTEGGAVAGGGIRVGDGRGVAMGLVTVIGNTGTGGLFGLGGGVGNEGGMVEMADTAIVNNTADNAGGIGTVDGTMFLDDSTVSGNTAVGAIGGILNLANSAGVTSTLDLDSVTIAANIEQAPSGSGAGLDTTTFDGDAVTTIRNSIIANNVGESQCFAGGSGAGGFITSLGYNLASDATCNLTGTADLPDTNPVLGPLTLGLGGTYYHPLLASSPAIDTGSTNGFQDQIGTPRPTDLPGYPNTTDGDDRGAFELVTVPTAVTLADFTSASAIPMLPIGVAGLSVALLSTLLLKRRQR